MQNPEFDNRRIYCPGAVTALYRPQRLPHLKLNPLVEALPESLDDDALFESMTVLPDFDPEQRNWTNAERIQMLMRLSKFLVPSSRQMDLARIIDSMLRNGYVGRAPRTPERAKRVQQLYEAPTEPSQSAMETLEGTTLLSTLLMGIPGMGKTSILKHLFAKYPEVIYHPDHHIYQVPCLHVEMPGTGSSVKGLANAILRKFDELFPKENYFRLYAKTRASEEEQMAAVGLLMDIHCVGLFIADEIQHLTKSAKGEQKVMSGLVAACNHLGVPILFVGTNKAIQVFSLDFRTSRRGTGYGLEHWDRLQEFDEANVKKSYVPEDGVPTSEWQDFLDILWTFQWVKNPVELDHALATTMYDLSQGVIDIAIKLFASVQAKAISNKSERISVELLEYVYQRHMSLIHPMIDALRSDQPRELMHFPDIAPIGLNEMLASVSKRARAQVSKSISTKPKEPSFLLSMVTALMATGIEETEATRVAREVLESGKASNLGQGVAEALSILKAGKKKSKSKRGSSTATSVETEVPKDKADYRNASALGLPGATAFDNLQKMGMAEPLEDTLEM